MNCGHPNHGAAEHDCVPFLCAERAEDKTNLRWAYAVIAAQQAKLEQIAAYCQYVDDTEDENNGFGVQLVANHVLGIVNAVVGEETLETARPPYPQVWGGSALMTILLAPEWRHD